MFLQDAHRKATATINNCCKNNQSLQEIREGPFWNVLVLYGQWPFMETRHFKKGLSLPRVHFWTPCPAMITHFYCQNFYYSNSANSLDPCNPLRNSKKLDSRHGQLVGSSVPGVVLIFMLEKLKKFFLSNRIFELGVTTKANINMTKRKMFNLLLPMTQWNNKIEERT